MPLLPGAIQTNLLSKCVHGTKSLSRTRHLPRIAGESATSRAHDPRAPRPRGNVSLRHRPEERVTPSSTTQEGAVPSPGAAEGSPRSRAGGSGGKELTTSGKQFTGRIRRPYNDPYGLPFMFQGRDFRFLYLTC